MVRKSVRVGLIGCGFFARNHLHAWRDLATDGAELVAVCDKDAGRAEAAAKEFGVPAWYTDAQKMLDEQHLGLVDIATQVNSHRALAELTLGHRVPTIVQKPMAPSLADAEAMVAAAAEAGTFLAVHENFRFQAPMLKVAQLLASGAIGVPNWARISFRTGYDIYAGQPYLALEERMALLDLGVHVLDVARVFLGEVAHLSCETQRRNPRIRGEDTATMLLRHVSGAVSVVECTYESRRLPDVFPETLIEVEGSEGSVVVTPALVVELTSKGQFSRIDTDPPLLDWTERPWHVVQHSVLETCRSLLYSVQEGSEGTTSGRDNLKTFALAEAAYVAAAEKRAVAPKY